MSAKFNFHVTTHALEQLALRFPEHAPTRSDPEALEPARQLILREARSALTTGRVSARKPEGLVRPADRQSLYVWTEDGERIYALRNGTNPPRFVVTTTFRRGVH